MSDSVLGERYRVEARIGAGGMAEVYRGFDQVLDRTVAIKVLLPQFARDAGFVGKTMFTPASLVLVVFGFLLVNEGNWSLGSTWLMFALAVFAASFAVGVGFLAPESARIERAIELHGVGSTEATRRIERIFLVSRIELLFLMLVVVDMVVKPGL